MLLLSTIVYCHGCLSVYGDVVTINHYYEAFVLLHQLDDSINEHPYFCSIMELTEEHEGWMFQNYTYLRIKAEKCTM